MLGHVLRAQGPGICTRNVRCFSQIQSKNQQDSLEKSQDLKGQLDALPKNQTKDNFLIEFRDRKPSYDQLFEYKIDEKPHMQSKPVVKSYIGPDFQIMLHKKYDVSFDSFKSWLRQRIFKEEVKNQQYQVRRHGILGPDLATAHFVLARGGKVRFQHLPDKWICDNKALPNVFDKKFRVLSLDASNIGLLYEGLDNMILLPAIEELHLNNNKLDDFACDKIARIFRNSDKLEYLDLSGNRSISHKGIEGLYKIKSLKNLIIKDTKAAEYSFIDLLVHMFQDVNPKCRIIYK